MDKKRVLDLIAAMSATSGGWKAVIDNGKKLVNGEWALIVTAKSARETPEVIDHWIEVIKQEFLDEVEK